MIRVDGLGHRFGALRVLDDVRFEVPKGEIFGFIGPNGAGKTTTLRVMATLLEPDEGTVWIDGIDVVEDPTAARQRVGFMPDSFGVYDSITVWEYLDFFAAAHGLDRHRRPKSIDAVMELTNLGSLRDRLVDALSKGMKQRLAIARTLLHDPEILILDEPANGLDPRARIEMRELIGELHRLGKTVVLSSHILTELSDIVTSVAILERGRLRAAGPLDAILRQRRGPEQLMLRLLAPLAPEARATIATLPGVAEFGTEDGVTLELACDGGDATVASIVATLVALGAGVVHVSRTRNDLERVFLDVTRDEVQ